MIISNHANTVNTGLPVNNFKNILSAQKRKVRKNNIFFEVLFKDLIDEIKTELITCR